ncbi:MAG: hypothetical protein K6T74_15835, partial [Geminicoccaceae bacterium]|nr:hypothetical protein [Geminicoccaceae bacterium]
CARRDVPVVWTTDHGSVHCRRPATVYAKRDATANLRYKIGDDLRAEDPRTAWCVADGEEIRAQVSYGAQGREITVGGVGPAADRPARRALRTRRLTGPPRSAGSRDSVRYSEPRDPLPSCDVIAGLVPPSSGPPPLRALRVLARVATDGGRIGGRALGRVPKNLRGRDGSRRSNAPAGGDERPGRAPHLERPTRRASNLHGARS